MKSILMYIIALTLLISLSACQLNNREQTNDNATKQTQDIDEISGKLINGLRHIDIGELSLANDMKIYRGETLKISISDSDETSLVVVSDREVVDVSDDSSTDTVVKVKMSELGDFTMKITQGDKSITRTISVIEYEKESIYKNLSAKEFEAAMDGDYLLLDVREQYEYDAGHIADATLIPLGELADRLGEIEQYKDKPVLVYCKSGNRSVAGSQILINSGFNIIYNLDGGYGAWTRR